jgi:hypothetical protein
MIFKGCIVWFTTILARHCKFDDVASMVAIVQAVLIAYDSLLGCFFIMGYLVGVYSG